MSQGTKSFLKFLAGVLVILGIAVAVLKTWYVDVVTVGHNGMAPTMIVGDQVLVWRDAAPEHGDIMLCAHPHESSRWVIGRIVGMPGMELSEARGQLRVNGVVPDRDFRGTIDFRDAETDRVVQMRWGIEDLGNDEHLFFIRADREYTMRPVARLNGYFLLGDNRTHAGEDSRTFGPVPPGTCRGQIFMRLTMSPDTPPEVGNSILDLLD